ncbi:hypothetical protein AgCh_010117 [Apium graveolens]
MGDYDEEVHEFKRFVADAEQPLFEGSDYTKLESMLKLHNWKSKFGISDAAFTELLSSVSSFLPTGHVLSVNAYEAKKNLSDLGLDYIKFLHSDHRIQDGLMRHPVDFPSWRNVDHRWPIFGSESRNLRLALSADGINPHNNGLTNRYSCWPVVLVTHNLRPWLCMKRKFMMLTLLVSGPHEPGNNIDVYLQPMIDDLKKLWEEGEPDVFDSHTKTYFTLRAMLLWTINDFPAYGNLSGCVNKGYMACPVCCEDTIAKYLTHSRKMCYQGHRSEASRRDMMEMGVRADLAPQSGTPGLPKKKKMHKEHLERLYRGKRKSVQWMMAEHNRLFADWFEKKVNNELMENFEGVSETIRWLAGKPSYYVLTYEGYVADGVQYFTKERDDSRVVHNSGMSLVAKTVQVSSANNLNLVQSDMTFYGIILDIWELDYHESKAPLFLYKWEENERGIKSDFVPAMVTTTESEKRRYGVARGPSTMSKVVIKKAQGKNFKVRCNYIRVLIGRVRHTLQSYIGMLARTMIPINIKSWPFVERELKNKLWKDIQNAFKIPEEFESLVLKSAGTKRRQFKSELTTDYVIPLKGDKKKLRKPPTRYRFVGTSQITERKSDATEVSVSDVKKGYICLEEEELKAGRLKPGEKPDRAILWKKACTTNEGIVVDPGLAVVVKRIDNLLEMKERGEFQPSGSDDAPRSCELSVDNIKNKVAFDTIFDDPVNSVVHGVPMQPGHVRVSVDGAIQADALLPMPIEGELETVRQAIGSTVSWPQDLITVASLVNNRNEGFSLKKKEKNQLQRLVAMFKEVEGSPKQPGGHEYGYVVMRYMKDIIEDKEMTFITKWANKSRKSYKMEELNVVCIEALAYIQDKI